MTSRSHLKQKRDRKQAFQDTDSLKIETSKRLWITWHIATRSRTLAKLLNVPIFELFITKNLLFRHLFSSLWTIWILIKERPKVIFLQMSFLLLIVIAIYKLFRFNKIIVIADCHTKALRRVAPGILNCIFWPLKKWSFKFVNVTIISNKGMIRDVQKLHHRYLIMPDKIPEITFELNSKKIEHFCVYISSFAVDEPFHEIFNVANLLSPEFKLYWTGKKPGHVNLTPNKPDNLIFTGYIDFDNYWNLIGNADCILALTTEEDCLQSAAYEALSVEVPMVISDTKALREFFQKSAVYTSHQPEQIAQCIRFAIEHRDDLIKEIREHKTVRNTEFADFIHKLEAMVDEDIRAQRKEHVSSTFS